MQLKVLSYRSGHSRTPIRREAPLCLVLALSESLA